MANLDQHPEWAELFGDYCNNVIDPQSLETLNLLLEQNPDAQAAFVHYMFLHADLYGQQANSLAMNPISRVRSDNKVVVAWPANLPVLAASLLALAIVGGLLGGYWMGQRLVAQRPDVARQGIVPAGDAGDSDRPLPAHREASGNIPAIGHISGTRNCLWASKDQGIGFGSKLLAGQQLHLARGLAEITFVNGAKVILEGPTNFEMPSLLRSVLQDGRMTASVPEQAKGYTVQSPGLTLVDLGTEFGMEVDRKGTTEIHVFDGLVVGHVTDHAGATLQTVRWSADEGGRLETADLKMTPLRADHQRFVHSISSSAARRQGLIAMEDFDYPTGPLDGQNGGDGWGGTWTDISTGGNLGSNRVAAGSLYHEGMFSAGNRASQLGQQNRVRRVLSTSIGGAFDRAQLIEDQDGLRLIGADGKTVYVSFIQKVDKLSQVYYGFEMHRGDGNGNRILTIGHGASETGYGVSSEFNGGAKATYQPLGKENNQPNFFVVRFDFGRDGEPDQISVYRNPESLLNEQNCQPDAKLSGNFGFDRISLGNFNGNKVHEADQIRIGSSFAAVTGSDSDLRDESLADGGTWFRSIARARESTRVGGGEVNRTARL